MISCGTGQPAPAQSKLLSRAQGGAWQGPWPESEKGAAVAPTSAREAPAQQWPPQLSPWAKRQAGPGRIRHGLQLQLPRREASAMGTDAETLELLSIIAGAQGA